MEQIRTFVAIELSDDLCAALRRMQATLKANKEAQIGRWVAPESIHLTLQFLGNVGLNRLAEIQAAIERGCTGHTPFDIELGGLGCFPNTRQPNVVWVGLAGDLESLQSLQHDVEQQLAALGFRPEDRPFKPHLTLARVRKDVSKAERAALGALVERTPCTESARMTVRQVSLMRSDLRPTGAVYTRLFAAELREIR
ncbi:MAG: RNA 2',3'-cyclic phosphodiesterase [Chloroflexi bacterium]|nr:RNA 2',3'-cyclic phosphodiesterase [Chloroflexota bacterium]